MSMSHAAIIATLISMICEMDFPDTHDRSEGSRWRGRFAHPHRVLIAHSSSNDESKPVLQPFDDAIPTPGFSSWRGLLTCYVPFSCSYFQDVFAGLVTSASATEKMQPSDWVMDVLGEEYHSHAALLNAVVPSKRNPTNS